MTDEATCETYDSPSMRIEAFGFPVATDERLEELLSDQRDWVRELARNQIEERKILRGHGWRGEPIDPYGALGCRELLIQLGARDSVPEMTALAANGSDAEVMAVARMIRANDSGGA